MCLFYKGFFLQAIVANIVVGMVVMTMIIGDHQDARLFEVVEVILLLVAPLMLKGQGGTGQGPILLMEAQTGDMGVALVGMATDEKVVVSNLEAQTEDMGHSGGYGNR